MSKNTENNLILDIYIMTLLPPIPYIVRDT